MSLMWPRPRRFELDYSPDALRSLRQEKEYIAAPCERMFTHAKNSVLSPQRGGLVRDQPALYQHSLPTQPNPTPTPTPTSSTIHTMQMYNRHINSYHLPAWMSLMKRRPCAILSSTTNTTLFKRAAGYQRPPYATECYLNNYVQINGLGHSRWKQMRHEIMWR